jgi:methionyl aminopeptidase
MDKQKIEAMRVGGRILAGILQRLKARVVPGVNELELDAWVEREILAAGAVVAYREREVGFPGAICISVNEELIHGVPEDNVLEAGDKASFDLTIGYRGYYTDSAFSMVVGEGSTGVKRLLAVTESSLHEGIAQVRSGATLGDVGAAVQATLEKGRLGVIRNYVGHGIGRKMHLPPDVPNYGRAGTGLKLVAGETFCIEPMSSMGKVETRIADDEWTVVLADGSIGAHFEHTVLVTETGVEVLTAWQ